jgi:hypothetical protein
MAWTTLLGAQAAWLVERLGRLVDPVLGLEKGLPPPAPWSALGSAP